MTVVLKVRDGERFRDVCRLESDRPIIIGRLPQSDAAFPGDFEMSGRHLSLTLLPDLTCRFCDPGSTNGTFVNEQRETEGVLRPGDVLRCGMTEFCIDAAETCGHNHTGPLEKNTPISHSDKQGADHMKAIAAVPQADRGFTGDTAEQIFKRYRLEKEISFAPGEDESPEAYARRLQRTSEENDCLLFLAYALPKRCAVWWLIHCIRAAESLKSDADIPMLQLAEDWVRQPSDDARRKAMQMAESLEMESPAAWAGVSAFWSHGSMAPPNAPDVPAPDHLTGKAVTGGAILATVLKTPENAAERRQLFTEIAIRIADGKLPWS